MSKPVTVRKRLNRDVGADISRKIIQYLVDVEGISVTNIAKMMRITKSYVSHIKMGRKTGLKVEMLARLERGLKQPLPILYMKVVEREPMPDELKPHYERLRKAWDASVELDKTTL